jgi:hypothetical protein
MSMRSFRRAVVAIGCLAASVHAEERVERFDRDPGWEGRNNRATSPGPRTIRQDFGYGRTAHAGGEAGEMGGFLCPAAEPAYYAKVIPPATFETPLSASGTIALDGRPLHALVGFFNAGTINEWRTPNTIALRISGRGDVFYAWVEYDTRRWRAGGDDPRGFATRSNPETGRAEPIGFAAKGAVHRWSLRYDPQGNKGGGTVTATVDDQTAVCNLSEGHKADGAEFNRFGLMTVMKSADSGGEVWMDDVEVNGVKEDFAADPGWEGFQNRRTYESANVRPRFDFGFSATQHAGGRGEGEMGGLVFRGDCRYPDKMACYGDRLDELRLDKPIRASGRVCLLRGVTDSTVLIGFYNSQASMKSNPSQDAGLPAHFLGVSIDGPSREGLFFAPAFRGDVGGGGVSFKDAPYIYPDATSHDWTLEYTPTPGGGRITVSLDGKTTRMDLKNPGKGRPRFDRFGLITTWIDGNGQTLYFDDLTYTSRQ